MRTEYTLPELCAELGLSPAWIRKILHYLGLKGWGGGQRGKRSVFDVEQFEFLRKIASLRRLGFGLEEIKRVYDKEKEIWRFVHRNLADEIPLREGEKFTFREDISAIPVYLNQDIAGSLGIGYNRKEFDRNPKLAGELQRLMAEYNILMKGMAMKADHNFGILKKEVDDIKSIVEK